MATSLVLQDGQRLPLVDGQRVGLTVQANDLLKPNSVQADYSSTLTLADTPEVRAALEQAQEGISLSDMPYTELPCTLETQGLEVLPNAVAIIEQHQAGEGFEAQVVGGNKSFYAAIEGKTLRELAFPAATEHDWTHTNAVAGAAHTSWEQTYVYDLYDRGKGGPLDGNTVHLHNDELLPSVYVRSIWEQIFSESGYRWAGPLPTLFDHLLMPTATPPGYGEEVRTATKLVAGIDNTDEKHQVFANAYDGREESVLTMPYDYTGARYGYLAPTLPGVHSTVTFRWKAPFVCYINAAASTVVTIDSPYGSGRAQLFFYIGSRELTGGTLLESKKTSQTPTRLSPSVNLSRYLIQKGEELEVRIKLSPGES
ncbi:hypothetical protein [Hymenobacter cellulosilyticus]|uniref:Uncharacterized protein n=1 Tax=Hymenobacter cellulosilyticus TaxID=2932248 RepID=A0A8T9Q0R8_9BACT|nr:hypothetical protein [Hymenobacter cellulosilyticus]UOQ70977.1 hypothetical protein MUN79_20200 [Hymenobacter cellulosilyticus]